MLAEAFCYASPEYSQFNECDIYVNQTIEPLSLVVLKIGRNDKVDISVKPGRHAWISNSRLNITLADNLVNTSRLNLTVNHTTRDSLRRLDFDLRRYETFVRIDSDEPSNKSSGHYIFKTAFPDSDPLKHVINTTSTYRGRLMSMFVVRYYQEGLFNNTFVRVMIEHVGER